MFVDTTLRLIGSKEALDGEELFTIEGSKNWRSTPDELKERGKCVRAAEKPSSHCHITASRNIVQIFKCELLRESRTTSTTKKISEILPKATYTDARGDCQILIVEIFPNFQV